MANSVLSLLGTVTIATTLATLAVAALRIPLRHAFGIRAAYWLWLLLPVSVVATLLPAPEHSLWTMSIVHQAQFPAARTIREFVGRSNSRNILAIALQSIWLLGGTGLLIMFVRRQRHFVASLGQLTLSQNGIARSGWSGSPVVLGFLRPQIILPGDFDAVYSREEQEMILAHERAHIARADPLQMSFAAAWTCVFWFNPLTYWAVNRLRLDQDLACDAVVLQRHNIHRARYAEALLKTQLTIDGAVGPPVGCYWGSGHPLKERVVALKRPLPSTLRRTIGIGISALMSIGSGYAVWAGNAASAPNHTGDLIAVSADWSIEKQPSTQNTATESTRITTSDMSVRDGAQFRLYSPNGQFGIQCQVSLPHQDRGSALAHSLMAKHLFVDGTILFECTSQGPPYMAGTPSLLVSEGQEAVIQSEDKDTKSRSTITFKASRATGGKSRL